MISGLYGKHVQFYKTMQSCFQEQLYHFASQEQLMRIPIAPYSHQQLVSALWTVTILNGMEQNLIVDCNSLMIKEHLFLRLFAICASSLVRCLFRSFAVFTIRLFVFLLLTLLLISYILLIYRFLISQTGISKIQEVHRSVVRGLQIIVLFEMMSVNHKRIMHWISWRTNFITRHCHSHSAPAFLLAFTIALTPMTTIVM